jgi:acyl-CoA synthetase (AMP-forming)/AMP-acid ligase II
LNIAQVLEDQARQRGDAPALVEMRGGRERRVTFRELESTSARIAYQLAGQGIGAGDSVFILHGMSAELYAFLIALFRIGAVGMFLDPSAGRAAIERCLDSHPPNAFFGSMKAQLLRLWIPALRRIGVNICTGPFPGALRISLGLRGSLLNAIADSAESAPALITFTSGSTGAPKGAVRTHGFLLAQHRALQESLRHRPGAMDLTTLPIFVLANLASGITSVFPDADMKRPGHIAPRPVLRQLETLSTTTMAASPAFVSRLTAECRRSGVRIKSLQRVFVGGAPVFPEDLRSARDAFPGAEIVAVYGSTEAEPMAEIALSSISADDFDAMARGRGLLAGKPVPSISLRILRDQWGVPIAPIDANQFSTLCLGAEKVGEIVVSGEHVLQGYLNGSDDAESKFRVDGIVWHRTGDLGRLDCDGRLWLMGRASAAVKDERGVVYPFAVECAARQIPGVRRAAILDMDGKRILAIETEARSSMASIHESMAWESMAWAGLDEIRVLRAIPMDKRHNAKIDYVALRGMLVKRK